MFKKILSTIIVFVVSLSTAFADGSFYIAPSITYVDVRSSDISYDAILPTFYVGYGSWVREWLNLSVEAFATSKSINTRDDNNLHGTLKMDYSYGLGLVPLVSVDETMFGFARIGYVRTKFPNLDSINNAYQLGLGIEAPLVGCWNARGEVDYVKYSSNSNSNVDIGSLHAVEFTIALVYRFGSLLRQEV